MKKHTKSLHLQKQTISNLKNTLIKGGATTTNTMITMADDCWTQRICDPVPSDPRPATGLSNCEPCTATSWNTTC